MAIIRNSAKKHINKNGNIEKRHIINKMKNKEFKYTFILVMVFMIIFVVIGYNALKFDNNLLLNDIKNVKGNANVSSSSQIVSLTSENIMHDSEGLSSYVYQISVKNDTSNFVNYQLNLVKDENISTICNCNTKQFSANQIKYSLNNTDVNILADNMLIKNIALDKGESEDVLVRVWVDADNVDAIANNDAHFHGHFVLNELNY